MEEDVVILNAVEDDLDLMTMRMEARQARLKHEKKLKKTATAIKEEPVEEAAGKCDLPETSTSAEVKTGIKTEEKPKVGSKLSKNLKGKIFTLILLPY